MDRMQESGRVRKSRGEKRQTVNISEKLPVQKGCAAESGLADQVGKRDYDCGKSLSLKIIETKCSKSDDVKGRHFD